MLLIPGTKKSAQSYRSTHVVFFTKLASETLFCFFFNTVNITKIFFDLILSELYIQLFSQKISIFS